MVLNDDHLWIHDIRGKVLLKVQRSLNRLYKLVIQECVLACTVSKIEELAWLWHSRLGLANFQALHNMLNKGMDRGLPKIVQPKAVCNGCLTSKKVRK